MGNGEMLKLTAKDNIPVITYSSPSTAMLDVDNDDFDNVHKLAHKIDNRFRMGGYLIAESSENCFHVVFNRPVTWITNMEIVAYACMQSGNKGLTAWFLQQCVKHFSSLRLNHKGEKPSPRIVYVYGRTDRQIRDYLETRELFKGVGGD